MASQKFSNFSIDYILGDTSGQTPPGDHPSFPRDFPGQVTRLDQLYHYGSGGHGEHAALMLTHHLSPSWAGMYSCWCPVSYYQMTFNSDYNSGQQRPSNTPGCDPAENQIHQHEPQRQRNRVRTVFADHQTHHLERLFAITDYPTLDARAELAKSTGLTEEIVRVWFKNRRARRKRQATCPGKSAKHPQDQHKQQLNNF
ncbi:Homeobox protein goosecoid [Triplophysa tibetana]|uniref:Homeobox protein goosecoid n=1 Tax=Triplophysa tibetana TaxID=1572043 RepID=A0A5A9MZL6_9TELE|nr:Homeobox protein goosecoid [Triplophysa tibetana]